MTSYTKPSHEKIMLNIMNSTTTSDECCLWTGCMLDNSCPYFYRINIRNYVWNLSNTNLERGVFLENTCPNKNCINIDHLQIKIKDRSVVNWDQVWERVLEKTKIVGECIVWTGPVNVQGYGKVYADGKHHSVHRLSYMIHKNGGEEISSHIEGKKIVVRHVCPRKHNPSCLNPEHLVLGTLKDNANDRIINDTQMKGGNSYNSKITEEIAQKIKLSLFKKGEEGYKTQKERAEFFQVTLGILAKIDSGLSWSHIKDRDGKDSSIQRDHNNHRVRENSKRKRETKITVEEFENAGKVLYSRTVKTSKNKKCDIQEDCWEYFFGKPRDNGYRKFAYSGRMKLAHVWSCSIQEKREILPGEVTRHLCGNKPCVNPSHLKFGTNSENSEDAILHGSKSAKLNAEKVREIRSSNFSKKELVKKYEVCRDTINRVLRRKTWKFV